MQETGVDINPTLKDIENKIYNLEEDLETYDLTLVEI